MQRRASSKSTLIQRLSGFMAGLARPVKVSSWILASFFALAPVQAAEPTAMDHLRAAYLYQFTKFVEWNQESEGPLVIALVGDDPLRGAEETIIGKRSQGRVIEVISLGINEQPAQTCCDVIYGRVPDLAELRGSRAEWFGERVLVVSDGSREYSPVPGAERWRTINMYTENNKLRFDVDLELAVRSGLTLGSELLKNAGAVFRGANSP